MVDNYILRANARKQLGGRIFANKWILCAVMFFIYDVIVVILNFASNIVNFSNTSSASSTSMIGLIASLAGLLVQAPLTLGLFNGCLKLVENDSSFAVTDVFSGLKRFAQAFKLQMMQNIYIYLWSLLFILPGIIKFYSYSMAFYIMRDNPHYSWRRNITESREMMDGHKAQLFLLDVSFIGWYLLGALCLGIGLLFVVPYHQMARANFYEALVAAREPNFYNLDENIDEQAYDPFDQTQDQDRDAEEVNDQEKGISDDF